MGMKLPLTAWEAVRVVVLERHNALGGDLHLGVITGKPGEGRDALVARAREKLECGFFTDRVLLFENAHSAHRKPAWDLREENQ
jgi:hypothetical protein